jgi:hypothetical protein
MNFVWKEILTLSEPTGPEFIPTPRDFLVIRRSGGCFSFPAGADFVASGPKGDAKPHYKKCAILNRQRTSQLLNCLQNECGGIHAEHMEPPTIWRRVILRNPPEKPQDLSSSYQAMGTPASDRGAPFTVGPSEDGCLEDGCGGAGAFLGRRVPRLSPY